MRILVILLVVAEALQWLLIIYLFATNARLKRERDQWRFANDPPRSVVDTESDFASTPSSEFIPPQAHYAEPVSSAKDTTHK